MDSIGVVLAAYNGDRYIRKQLDSILSQDQKVDELLIIDDGSTDGTRAILREYEARYKGVRLVFNDRNMGSPAVFFYGLSLSRSDYILFCDQDDIWFDDKVSTQLFMVKDREKRNNYVCCFHNAKLIDSNDNILEDSYWKYRKLDPKGYGLKKSLTRNIMTGCTMMINRSLANIINEKVLSYDGILFHDHFISLVAYSLATVVAIDRPLMYYRNHSASVTAKENISPLKKIMNVSARLAKNDYLTDNILQGERFLSFFGDVIAKDQKRNTEKFIALKNRPKFFQIIWQFKNK